MYMDYERIIGVILVVFTIRSHISSTPRLGLKPNKLIYVNNNTYTRFISTTVILFCVTLHNN